MEEIKMCEGQTSFGITVLGCDQPATHFPCQDKHECYQFCERHYYFYLHGRYPADELEQYSERNGDYRRDDD